MNNLREAKGEADSNVKRGGDQRGGEFERNFICSFEG